MIPGGGAEAIPAAGEPARHVPVLCEEAVAALAVRSGGIYVDATFGAGGYTRALLGVENARVVAFDRDPEAIRAGSAMAAGSHGRLRLVSARFGELDLHLDAPVNGVVLDIGVSSMQLDETGRGFSFRYDGPLDMRMERDGRSAADIVNEDDEATIADILYHFGEERASRRIARAIVADRAKVPWTTTRPLAEMIERVAPTHADIHPATRTFQALRIAVNDELGELVRGLEAAERVLKDGGRLAVVTFHSLEDRIVKRFFAALSGAGRAQSRHLPGEPAAAPSTFVLEGRQPIVPSVEEARRNPRARSAKLRVATRTAEAPHGAPAEVRALAELPHRRPGKR